MEFTGLITMLAANYPIVTSIAAVLGMLVVVGQAVVVMTPTKADDAAWEKIKAVPLLGGMISALANFAPIQKK